MKIGFSIFKERINYESYYLNYEKERVLCLVGVSLSLNRIEDNGD